ncbi:MAG: type II secretion system protein [Candidatus Paceibacterota bacterium]
MMKRSKKQEATPVASASADSQGRGRKNTSGFTPTPSFLSRFAPFAKGERTGNLVSGFTLVETLVAVSILLVSIGGPLTIAQRGISSAFFARDQITAFYLAQEAVEYIRNVRDSNKLAGDEWTLGFEDCIGSVCLIDAKTNEIEECIGGSCDPLKYDGEFYTYESGENSHFTREVVIETVNGNEIDVQVTISWQSTQLSRSFTISEHIFDW